MHSSEAADCALDGLRILDFSRVLAGPLATMVLADLGAEVIKVERPDGGDETRAWGPPWDERGRSTYFQSINRNKRSIVLDLKLDRDVEEARRLGAHADVIVENFRPGVMQRYGLDYQAIRERNPRIIYCTITGFGSGRGARLPGYDLLVQALGGLMSITGPPDGEPQKVGVALVDVITGLYATVGILAAARYRDRSGEGQRVEVNLLSCLLAALVNQGSAYSVARAVPSRLGNRHPSISPYELFTTADGELVLAVGNDRQFSALCSVLGDESLADDSRFATNGVRVEHRDALKARLEALLVARPAAEWADLLTTRGVAAGAVNDIATAFSVADSLGLDPIVELVRDDGSRTRLTRNPIDLSLTPPAYRLAPPDLPEH